MFGWFKRKAIGRIIRDGGAGKMLDQLALAVTVSEVASEYLRANKNLPICKDRDTTVLDMWIGTRLEAISLLWNCGAANIELIISPSKHPQLLDVIIEEACNPLSVAFFLPRETTGDEIKDSISAILRVYDYLYQLENDVAVPFRPMSEGEPGSRSRYASFLLEMQKLQVKWQGFKYAVQHNAYLPDQPETIFMPLWRDVTFRAKMIALCGQFGPYYIAMCAAVRQMANDPAYVAGLSEPQRASEQHSRVAGDTMFVKILSVDDPDQIRGTPYSIGSHPS
jgi:hypothetical protein